jgi:hypothetical protein
MQSGRRKEARTAQCIPVKCSCSDKEECEECDIPGLSVNNSKSGMCIHTFSHFPKGAHINVECHFNGLTMLNGTVMWCKEIFPKKLYRMGVSFD